MREVVISSPARNAVSTALLDALTDHVRQAAGEPLLLTGAGETFSAGLDLSEIATIDTAGARRLLASLELLVETLFTYPAPTVALVNGHAIAGGCVLALACDHRVATSDPRVRIGLNEVALGLPFPPKTLAMVRARLTRPAAEHVILGAQLHDPAQACRLGLVDEIADDARAVALERLDALSRHPRPAYARAKQRLRGSALALPDSEQRILEEEVLPRWASEDIRNAAARQLRRTPR